MQNRIILIIIGYLCILCCENPFEITPSGKTDYIQLDTEYNTNQRIIDTLSVKLKWNDITLDNFKEIKITRFNEHRHIMSYIAGTSIYGLITIATINNPFITLWIDIVTDDAVFQYDIRYYDIDNNYHQSNTSVTIRPTTHVFVPFEFDSIGAALDSYILDDGDTIFKCVREATFSDTIYREKPDTFFSRDTVVVITLKCD